MSNRIASLALLGALALVNLTGCTAPPTEAYGKIVDKEIEHTMAGRGPEKGQSKTHYRLIVETSEGRTEKWLTDGEAFLVKCKEGDHIHRSVEGALTCSEESLR